MSEQKIIVTAVVKSEVEHAFRFIYDGNKNDKHAKIDAAWDAFNNERYLREPEISSDDIVGMELEGTELCNPDDFRAKPKQRTKKQLWRRVARLAGELALSYGPDLKPLELCDLSLGRDAVIGVIESARMRRRSLRLANKLEAAFKEWEAAQ